MANADTIKSSEKNATQSNLALNSGTLDNTSDNSDVYDGVYFKSSTPQKSWLGPTLTANKIVDVFNDCTWAINISDRARGERPVIYLTEYKLNLNSAVLQALQIARAATGSVQSIAGSKGNILSDDPYLGLYSGTPTGFNYVLPIINPESLAWQSSGAFGGDAKFNIPLLDKVAKEIQGITEAAEAISQISNLENETGSEQIKKYNVSTEGQEFEIEFTLFNTESIIDIQKNWEVAFLLTYQNLQMRESTNLVLPPHIYSFEIPGIKSSAACTLQSSVELQGQTRMLNVFGVMRAIPEAYYFKLKFKDLIGWGRNNHGYALSGSKINVISDVATNGLNTLKGIPASVGSLASQSAAGTGKVAQKFGL